MPVKENAHFYHPDGYWAETVEGAKGQPVTPDARHARKLGLYVGCTGPLNFVPKPELDDWKQRELARHIQEIVDEGVMELSDEGICRAAQRRMAEALDEASKRGSMIHAVIECAIRGEEPPYDGLLSAYVDTVLPELDGDFPGWGAEEVWVNHDYRVGGKTDLLWRGTQFLRKAGDIKSRSFTAADVEEAKSKRDRGNKYIGRLTPYSTEPMQVAANIFGQGGSLRDTIGFNLYLDREDPTLIYVHEYTADEMIQAWEAYKCVLRFYQITKGLPVGPALLKEAA